MGGTLLWLLDNTEKCRVAAAVANVAVDALLYKLADLCRSRYPKEEIPLTQLSYRLKYSVNT